MKTPARGVQTLYTEERLLRYLWLLKLSGKSLRAIANDEFPGLTHGDIQRALHGKFPNDKEKRRLFGLGIANFGTVTDQEIRIKDRPYTVECVIQFAWITPQHPNAPVLVIVKPAEEQKC